MTKTEKAVRIAIACTICIAIIGGLALLLERYAG
jgi:hypothetical protein